MMMVKMTEDEPGAEGPWSLPEPAWRLVPVQPDDNMAGELARDIVMWWSFSPPTGDALYRHLRRLGREIPAWLPGLIADRMYVPPKGAVAAAIYRAMLDAAPAAPQMTDAEMDDAIKRDEAEQERAHVAYQRGIDEGKRQAAAPQQAEPVAWMFDRRYGSGLSFGRPADYENEDGDTISPTPLWRHPPADEVQRLRDALKPFAAIDLTTNQAVDPMDVLRARRALEGE